MVYMHKTKTGRGKSGEGQLWHCLCPPGISYVLGHPPQIRQFRPVLVRDGFGITWVDVWSMRQGSQGYSGKSPAWSGKGHVQRQGAVQGPADIRNQDKQSVMGWRLQPQAHTGLWGAFSLRMRWEAAADCCGSPRSDYRCSRVKVLRNPQGRTSMPNKTEPRLAAVATLWP